MKKSFVLLSLVFIVAVLFVMPVMAQDCPPNADCGANPCAKNLGTYCVTYHENNCLNAVPIDQKAYRYGETVRVLFEPVLYKSGLIFHGWSHNPYGLADYGYNYDQFVMPAKNIDLYAICIVPYYGPTKTETGCCDPCYPTHHDYYHYDGRR